MKHEILIYNKTRRRIPEKLIKLIILKALQFLKLKQPIQLAVLIVDKKEIKRLNKIWRKVNETPDELSFGLNSRFSVGRVTKFAKGFQSVLDLGEIIVNVEKISDKNRLPKILIHSSLHLLGYSHGQMEGLENKILKSLEIRN